MKTIAVDFDGVIHSYHRGWQDGSIYGQPILGSIQALSTLMRDHAVFVHTTREPSQVAGWIEQSSERVIRCTVRPVELFWEELGVLLVTNRKLPAVAYVDDRGIRFQSWAQALGDLSRYAGVAI